MDQVPFGGFVNWVPLLVLHMVVASLPVPTIGGVLFSWVFFG